MHVSYLFLSVSCIIEFVHEPYDTKKAYEKEERHRERGGGDVSLRIVVHAFIPSTCGAEAHRSLLALSTK